MASVEAIALETYPVWDRQPDEPAEKYQIFERYFLPFPKASVLGSFKKYKDEIGENSKVNNASSAWRDDAIRFRWKERHQAYWRHRNHTDQQWRQQQIEAYQAETLDTARLLRVKAVEILENFDIANASPKDAAALLRLSDELVATALDWRDIDKAVAAVHRWGLEVYQPESDQTNGHGDLGAVDVVETVGG